MKNNADKSPKERTTKRKLIDIDKKALKAIEYYCSRHGGSSKAIIEELAKDFSYEVIKKYPNYLTKKKSKGLSFKANTTIL